MKNRSTRFYFEILGGYELRIIISHDIVASGKRLREDLRNAAAAFVDKDNQPGIGWLIFPPEATPGLIAHESYHAVVAILKYHGASLSDEEQVAHWLTHIVDRVHAFIHK